MTAATSASPPMTPPTIGPMGVELLDCEIGVGVGLEVGVVGFGKWVEVEIEDEVGVVELESARVLVVDCAAPPTFVSARPTCPE
jgi:hypothetical protein